MRDGVYFWHSPFEPARLDLPDTYVRVATLSYDGDRLTPILPVQFQPSKGAVLTLVMNFDAGALSHFEEMDLSEAARVVAKTFRSASDAAKKQGATVRGLQLDLDCPTRLLPRYGDFLRRVRSEVPEVELSMTGLVSWIGDDQLLEALKPLDYWVPQFYEGRLPQRFEEDVPVSDDARIAKLKDRLGKLGTPFRVGVAAYGQALLFDREGHLEGTFRSFGLAESFRHPRFRLESVRRVSGEVHVRFQGVAKDGQTHGILFRVPTAEAFRRAWETAGSGMPANFGGRILFRAPQDGEATTLPRVALQRTLKGESVAPDIRLSSEKQRNPFAMIEGEAEDLAETVKVQIENRGTATQLETKPVAVLVRFSEGCAEIASNGSADALEWVDSRGGIGRVSRERAVGVRFLRWFLSPGETKELGTVRLKSGCEAQGVTIE